jgi:uncharacterized protein (DUF58 family)
LRDHAEALAAKMPPLLVAALRVAATVAPGTHGRRRVGTGDAFWQFRHYQSFDSARLIDWRRSATGQTTYVREKELETAQTVHIWRDPSPSMRWSSGRDIQQKRDRADLLAMALAVLLIEGGERVALLGESLRPRSGRPALEPIAELLVATGNGAGSLPVSEPLSRHASVVLIGDLFSPLEELDALVGQWAGDGVRGHLLQVTDPAEESFPYTGRVRFEGLEDEAPHLLGRAEVVSEAYLKRLQTHRAGLADIARRFGWSFGHHVTDRSPTQALLTLHTAISERVG